MDDWGEKEPGTWCITNEDCSSMLNPPKYQPSTSLLLHTGLSALRTRTTVLLNRPLSQQHLDPFPLPRLQEPVMCFSRLRPSPVLTSIVEIIGGVLSLLLVRVRPQEVKFTILELKRKKNWPTNKRMRQRQFGTNLGFFFFFGWFLTL